MDVYHFLLPCALACLSCAVGIFNNRIHDATLISLCFNNDLRDLAWSALRFCTNTVYSNEIVFISLFAQCSFRFRFFEFIHLDRNCVRISAISFKPDARKKSENYCMSYTSIITSRAHKMNQCFENKMRMMNVSRFTFTHTLTLARVFVTEWQRQTENRKFVEQKDNNFNLLRAKH